jgi:hypothetical protein
MRFLSQKFSNIEKSMYFIFVTKYHNRSQLWEKGVPLPQNFSDYSVYDRFDIRLKLSKIKLKIALKHIL